MCCVIKGIAIDVQIRTVYKIICINDKVVYVYIQVYVYTRKERGAVGAEEGEMSGEEISTFEPLSFRIQIYSKQELFLYFFTMMA